MKKLILSAIMIVSSVLVNAQEVTLTNEGFVDVNDNTKNYVIIEAPGISKDELYKKTKIYLNTLYNNPDFVSTDVTNEQIVIDAHDNINKIKVMFRMNGSNIWHTAYKYDFQFKDGKIKFTPYFKNLYNDEDSEKIYLIGNGLGLTTTGIFNKKGKVLKKDAPILISEDTNEFISKLKNNISSGVNNNDW